jgi:membrane associated rhomboid family serine protease
MSLLSKLERRLTWLAIPNLTVYLIFAQTCAYLITWAQEQRYGHSQFRGLILLAPSLVVEGQVWRLVTFLANPPSSNPFWTLLGLYFFYIMGTALERQWGEFRYTVYLLIAWVTTIAGAFLGWALMPAELRPIVVAGNAYIGGSVFLAFAYLFPEFVIYLFFILPVKVKWMALVTWLFYGYQFITGTVMTKVLIVASVLNFLLFFGKDIVLMAKTGQRRMKTQAQKIQDRDKPFHVCATCGITDKTNPKMDFRYCPLCFGSWGYCTAHIDNHVHKTAPPND